MRVALTGTPGTGKSEIAKVLVRKGYRIVLLDEIARKRGLILGVDEERGSLIVDLDSLNREVSTIEDAILVSHYSHLLDVDIAVVLRTHPRVLEERLRGRGYSPEKIRENVEAEAMSLITSEAIERLGRGRVHEVDTTSKSPEEAAREVEEAMRGRGKGAWVDWSEVILGWY